MKNGDIIIDIISQARGEKTNNNVSLKTPIKEFDISVNKELESAINSSIKDFKATLTIKDLILTNSAETYKINNIALELENESIE